MIIFLLRKSNQENWCQRRITSTKTKLQYSTNGKISLYYFQIFAFQTSFFITIIIAFIPIIIEFWKGVTRIHGSPLWSEFLKKDILKGVMLKPGAFYWSEYISQVFKYSVSSKWMMAAAALLFLFKSLYQCYLITESSKFETKGSFLFICDK